MRDVIMFFVYVWMAIGTMYMTAFFTLTIGCYIADKLKGRTVRKP